MQFSTLSTWNRDENRNMVHTYLRDEDGGYWIGMWIPDPNKLSFWKLFKVPNLRQALVAVNCLNGGARISPDALHILEEK